MNELMSPRAERLAAGFVPQIRFGPITMDMFEDDILLTSSHSATFIAGNERRMEE